MRKTHNRRSSFYFTNGRVTTGFFKEVQQVPYYHTPTTYASPAYNYPQTYGYAAPPVTPQGAYYGSPYRPHPALTYQPAPLITYPNTTYNPPASTYNQPASAYNQPASTYNPPASNYLRVPQNQFGGSDRSLTYASPRSVASSPYINANSIQDWAHSVHRSNNRSPGSVRSDAQYVGSPSHRSEKHNDRDRRRDDKKSRRGSVYPPPYDYDYGTNDYKTDGGSRADERSWGLDPQPNVLRREPTTHAPHRRRSCGFYVTWAR